MNRIQPIRRTTLALLTCAALPAWSAGQAQEVDLSAGLEVQRLVAEPSELVLVVGDEVEVSVVALDVDGRPVEGVVVRWSAPFRDLRVRRGNVRALQPGAHELVATVVLPADAELEPASVRIPVSVTWPTVARVEVKPEPGRLYVGTTLGHEASAFHPDGSRRPEPRFRWSSSTPEVATVDRHGNVTAHRPGAVTITASLAGAEGAVRYEVAPFPATRLEIAGAADQARTGDVLRYAARLTDDAGREHRDVPVTWSYTYAPDDSIRAPGAAAEVLDGAFVAEEPGVYTILASAGPLTARTVVDVRPRQVVRRVSLAGHGGVNHVHTSDLWVFEGRDGRDYAVTGTWGGDGWAYFWDVTDPSNIVRIDSLQVDARTVNDVKVSPDARYAALSREGASNRRNGVVIVDLSDPAHPEIASVYDDGLTGGVHNMFATDDYLFALSAGDKYVILDVTDLRNPRYVSEYNHPESRIHDVWVHDGIAYSSEWGNGVVVVDVGNGRWGGSIENPVFVTNVPYPVGATHAAFPYFQEETGKFYLLLGDEIMRREGLAWGGVGTSRIPERGGLPTATQGYLHIIDFTDPEHPEDVARYEVDEFGTHNIWVEDDVLYQAYYEGGLRVVDISGPLLGDLYEQGREMAVFKPFDPAGYTANAPMTWGAQPHKGHVFFTDFNSGLWSVKLEPPPGEPIS